MEAKPSSDIAFTASVKAIQSRRGSREAYAKMEASGGFQTKITPDLVAFLAGVDTAYLATANAAGQPYVQHRGGPKGFIHALDENTLGFADYAGNRQYVTLGNLAEKNHAFLFLMDYAHRRRIKIWGSARIVEADPELISRLMPKGYPARALSERSCSRLRLGTSTARAISLRSSTPPRSPRPWLSCKLASNFWKPKMTNYARRQVCRRRTADNRCDVRFWHKADMAIPLNDVRFWG